MKSCLQRKLYEKQHNLLSLWCLIAGNGTPFRADNTSQTSFKALVRWISVNRSRWQLASGFSVRRILNREMNVFNKSKYNFNQSWLCCALWNHPRRTRLSLTRVVQGVMTTPISYVEFLPIPSAYAVPLVNGTRLATLQELVGPMPTGGSRAMRASSENGVSHNAPSQF